MSLKERIVNDKVMFRHLRKLHLFFVYMDDDMFQGIMDRCPLIEDLRVMYCESLERIKVTNLYNLKKLDVTASEARPIEIFAPNLQYFNCSPSHGSSFDLYTTQNLKYLSLLGGTLPSATFFDDFMGKFPQLENLRLNGCRDLERIDISSHSLKRIEIVAPTNLREIKIDAPNVVSFDFDSSSTVLSNLSFVSALSRQWIRSRIYISSYSPVDMHLFCRLKRFLAELIHSKISLHLRFLRPQDCSFDHYVTKVPIFPLMEVENAHLSFDVAAPLTNPNILLEALFRTCRPKAINMNRYENATGLLYNNLADGRHELKHYNQHLKEVRFEIYDETKHEWQPGDWKNMLEAPRCWQRVCFGLQWGGN